MKSCTKLLNIECCEQQALLMFVLKIEHFSTAKKNFKQKNGEFLEELVVGSQQLNLNSF